MIFRTVFKQSWTVLRFVFYPGTDVFGFCGVFWYPNNLVRNREGAKRCPVLCGSEIWVILCVIIGKMNNMMFVCEFCYLYICELNMQELVSIYETNGCDIGTTDIYRFPQVDRLSTGPLGKGCHSRGGQA